MTSFHLQGTTQHGKANEGLPTCGPLAATEQVGDLKASGQAHGQDAPCHCAARRRLFETGSSVPSAPQAFDSTCYGKAGETLPLRSIRKTNGEQEAYWMRKVPLKYSPGEIAMSVV